MVNVQDFSLLEQVILSSLLSIGVLLIAYAVAGYYERRGHRRQMLEKAKRLKQAGKLAPQQPRSRAMPAVAGGSGEPSPKELPFRAR